MHIPIQDYYNIPQIRLTYKTRFKASERPQVSDMAHAYEIFARTWDDDKLDFVEEAKVMLLNQANRVLGICDLSSGGITGTVMDIRHILAAALKANANQIIVAHNHPSDNLSPSSADQAVTEKLQAAAACHDIRLVDHLIICRSGCYSLTADQKILAPVQKTIAFPAP